ncbi:MAG: glycosyltransferase [Calditrichaceae bacterium]
MNIEVSVVIPSYNSAGTITACLNSLMRQDYDKSFEITVVDSSTDNTAQIITAGFPEVKVIRCKRKTDPGTARNMGVNVSHGKYIMFLDSDCIAGNDWVSRIIRVYESPDYDAVGGSIYPANPETDVVGWAGYIAEFREFIPGHPAAIRDHLPTCNLSYRRDKFLEVGNFNAAYYPQEDLFFNHHFTKNGFKIFFDPEIKVFHFHRNKLAYFLKHQKNIGYITSSLLKKIDLEGSRLVRHKFLALINLPLLPFIKFYRTLAVFAKVNPAIIKAHILSFLVFALGLVPWTLGFAKGLLAPKFDD